MKRLMPIRLMATVILSTAGVREAAAQEAGQASSMEFMTYFSEPETPKRKPKAVQPKLQQQPHEPRPQGRSLDAKTMAYSMRTASVLLRPGANERCRTGESILPLRNDPAFGTNGPGLRRREALPAPLQ